MICENKSGSDSNQEHTPLTFMYIGSVKNKANPEVKVNAESKLNGKSFMMEVD